jgi:peptidoglycan/xylan/chitin deacetylase (PgdA/CDA1 family)
MSRRFAPVVLCYHAVSDSWRHPLAVGIDALERHVRGLLRRGYRPAGIDDVTRGRGRTLHVTFDDALRSIRDALAVLEQLGVPATIFVCSGFADDGRAFPLAELELDPADEPAGPEPDYDPAELATMTWDELGEVAERGVTIASHTVSHPHLPRLSTPELAKELGASRDSIESHLGRPCSYVAYPFGDHDARVRTAARAAGYRAAFALPGRDQPIDIFALPRVGIWRNDGPFRVWLKTSVARPSSPVLQTLLRRRDGGHGNEAAVAAF